MTAKEKLHHLVDRLPEGEVQAAERYLEYLSVAQQDPFLQTVFNAPLDDEPETDEERAAIADARAALRRGDVVSDEQVRRDLGL